MKEMKLVNFSQFFLWHDLHHNCLICFSEFPKYSGQHFLSATYVGLFEMGVTFIIWSLALKKSKQTAGVSKLIYLVPFISLIVIYFVLGEEIQKSTLYGLVFIISGLIFDNINFSKLVDKIKTRRLKRKTAAHAKQDKS